MTIRSDRGVGKLYLREGQVYDAEIESNPIVKSRKAFYRMFAWTDGSFDLRPAGIIACRRKSRSPPRP